MVKIRCRIRPMTARGDPWQPSHSLGVAVIGHGYWELNLVRDFADLNSARIGLYRRHRHPGCRAARPGDRRPGLLLSRVIQRMDQKARSKRP
jgi:hypothetical protein